MKRTLKVCSSVLLCLLVEGCVLFSPIDASLPTAPSSESNSKLSETKLLNEPPIPDYYKDAPLPDFLSEEQQNLYLRAMTIYVVIKSDTTGMDNIPFDEGCSASYPSQSFKTEWGWYRISTGRYQRWEDFDTMMHDIFTDNYIQLLTGADNEFPIFFEKDGLLCYFDIAKGSRWGHQEPDEFQLVEKTESSISFEIIGRFESHESEGIIETETFPVCLLLTEEGWRFDQFAIPMLEP